MFSIINNLELAQKYNRDSIKEIFGNIDKDKTGFINKTELVDYLENDSTDHYIDLYDKMNKTLLSKSEKIILRLKKLRTRSYMMKDIESVDDINWIIKTLHDRDLHDYEIEHKEDEMHILGHYSNHQQKINQKE